MTQNRKTRAADECNGFYHRYYRRQNALQETLEGTAGTVLLIVGIIAVIWLIAVSV